MGCENSACYVTNVTPLQKAKIKIERVKMVLESSLSFAILATEKPASNFSSQCLYIGPLLGAPIFYYYYFIFASKRQ